MGVPTKEKCRNPSSWQFEGETPHWHHCSQTGHDLLLIQSSLPAVIMLKSNKASDIQALESSKFITNPKTSNLQTECHSVLKLVPLHLNYFHEFAFLKECRHFSWDILSVLISLKSHYLLEQSGLAGPSHEGLSWLLLGLPHRRGQDWKLLLTLTGALPLHCLVRISLT